VKIKSFGYILLVLFLYCFSGCDPVVGYEYYLNNQSDSTLTVAYISLGFEEADTLKTILPETEMLISDMEVWGSHPHDEGEDFLRMFDTLIIMKGNQELISMDFYNRENWDYDNDIVYFGIIKTGTNIYSLEISNEDLK